MPVVHRLRRNDLLTLFVVLFAAALVRLSDPSIVEFKLDEAWVSRLAREWVGGGPLPLTGMPSSVGVPNPPTSVYVMAIPYAFTSDPVIATMFVAVLNVVGVGLLWLLAFRYWGRTAALVAGLMYAVSPWAVLYSRKIWAQNLHTPLVLMAVLLGLYGFLEGKRWAQVLCLPVLIFALQIHFAAFALFPLYLWLLWTGRQRIWWPGLALSVVLAALTLAPYVASLNGNATGALVSASGLSSGTPEFRRDALEMVAELATGVGMAPTLASEATASDLLRAVPAPEPLWLVLAVPIVAGLGLVWTRRYRGLAGLITLWVVLPLLFFSLDWTQVHAHYFIASIPALFLLAGVTMDWLSRNVPGQPFTRTILLVSLVTILMTQFVWWRGVMRYVALGTAPNFGVPLGQLMPIRDLLMNDDDVVIVTRNSRIDQHVIPAIWHTMLYSPTRCVTAIDGEVVLPQPQERFTVMVAPDGADEVIDAYALGEPISIPVGNGDVYRIYSQATSEPVDTPDWQHLSARFDNGVTLTGYRADNDKLRLSWTTPGPQLAQYQYFVHLLDASGERVDQFDGSFMDGRYWCIGTPVTTEERIDVPPQAAILRVGMYRLVGEEYINANALDENGNVIAPWYDILLPVSEGS
jgi:hypothetical protein